MCCIHLADVSEGCSLSHAMECMCAFTHSHTELGAWDLPCLATSLTALYLSAILALLLQLASENRFRHRA